MKTFLLFSILFSAIALPAVGELSSQDLENIRNIIKSEINEELKPIKTDIAAIKTDIVTLKKDVAWLRGRFEGIDKQFESINQQFVVVQNQISHTTNLTYGLIALIVAAIAIPQIIITWRSLRETDQHKINQELRQEIEALKQQRIVNP